MRLAAGLFGGAGLFIAAALLAGPANAEYYCSVGFEPTAGGRCVAVAARDEIHLYLNDPALLDEGVRVRRRHHHRRGLSARY